MPKECDLALQNIIPLSKQPFKTQTRIENEDVRWSPQYNMPTTRTNRHRALSLREVELDDSFLILHIVLETCTIVDRIHAPVSCEFCISFLYPSIDILDLNKPFNSKAEIWEPFKLKLIWGLRSWTLLRGYKTLYDVAWVGFMPQSHELFHPVPSAKLLGIMLRNRCQPITFHTITIGDANGWCHKWLAWSTPQLCYSTSTHWFGNKSGWRKDPATPILYGLDYDNVNPISSVIICLKIRNSCTPSNKISTNMNIYKKWFFLKHILTQKIELYKFF